MNNLIDAVNKTKYKPRFHGNGFVQLYLNSETRIHIWHPDLPPLRDNNSMIHNHRFKLFSNILFGEIEHITYDSLEDSESPTHNIILIEGASKSRKANFKVQGSAEIIERHRYRLSKGSSYNFNAGLFHTSTPVSDIAVTLMQKEDDPSVEWASLATLMGAVEPTHAFTPATQPTQEKLWEVILEAVGLTNE